MNANPFLLTATFIVMAIAWYLIHNAIQKQR